MTNPALRVIETLTSTRLARAVIERLPGPVGETLRTLGDELRDRDASDAEEVRHGDIDGSVRASAFALGDVRDGAVVRAVNVVKGTVHGGSLRAVNLVLGDVLGGELRAVNVIVGDVHGGTLRDVHLIVGDVHGGQIESCYAVIGNVRGGRGCVSRVIGEVTTDEVDVERRVDPAGR